MSFSWRGRGSTTSAARVRARVRDRAAPASPRFFFSRRIGLNQVGTQNRVVPINAGGRLTGKVGKTTIGLLNVYAGDDPIAGGAPATDFSVLRVREDLFRRSSVGLLFTGRSVSTVGSGGSESYGVDTTIGLKTNLAINAYAAATRTPGVSTEDTSYRGDFNYNADRYGLEFERLVVGTHFNPDVGFLRRAGFHSNSALLRFSPRPRRDRFKRVRRFTYQTDFGYLTDSAGRLETRTADAQFGAEFQNSDRLGIAYVRSYEYLAGAVCHCRRRQDSDRRLLISGRARDDVVREPAQGVGVAVWRLRHFLRRSPHHGQLQRRTDSAEPAVHSGAERFGELGQSTGRAVHHPAGFRANDVHVVAVRVHQRARAGTTSARRRSVPTCGFDGNIVPGASYSSSLPTSGIPSPEGFRTSRTVRWSSR